LISETRNCTTTTTKTGSTESCTYAFTYAAPATARAGRVLAMARVRGHRRVVAYGRLRHHRLTLTVRRLHHGHYRLTLFVRAYHKWVLIGHTRLTIS